MIFHTEDLTERNITAHFEDSNEQEDYVRPINII